MQINYNFHLEDQLESLSEGSISRLLTLAITKSKESLRMSVDKRIAFSK